MQILFLQKGQKTSKLRQLPNGKVLRLFLSFYPLPDSTGSTTGQVLQRLTNLSQNYMPAKIAPLLRILLTTLSRTHPTASSTSLGFMLFQLLVPNVITWGVSAAELGVLSLTVYIVECGRHLHAETLFKPAGLDIILIITPYHSQSSLRTLPTVDWT